MALINCPECQNEVSNEASNCPHCGYPLSEMGMRKKWEEIQSIDPEEETPFLDFIKFEKMVTPTWIRLCFIIGVIAFWIEAIDNLIDDNALGFILFFIVAPVLCRFALETLIVIFSIHESIIDIKRKL